MPKSKKKDARLSLLDKAGNAYFKAVYEANRDPVREKREQAAWVKVCMAVVMRNPDGLDPMQKMSYASMVREEKEMEAKKAKAKEKKRSMLRPRA